MGFTHRFVVFYHKTGITTINLRLTGSIRLYPKESALPHVAYYAWIMPKPVRLSE